MSRKVEKEFWYPSEDHGSVLLMGQVEWCDDSFSHEFGTEVRKGYAPVSDEDFTMFLYLDSFEYDITQEFRDGHPSKYESLKEWFNERLNEEAS